jgi:hypothetical protein
MAAWWHVCRCGQARLIECGDETDREYTTQVWSPEMFPTAARSLTTAIGSQVHTSHLQSSSSPPPAPQQLDTCCRCCTFAISLSLSLSLRLSLRRSTSAPAHVCELQASSSVAGYFECCCLCCPVAVLFTCEHAHGRRVGGLGGGGRLRMRRTEAAALPRIRLYGLLLSMPPCE